MEKNELKEIANDLDGIKKLMILSLVQKGFKKKQLASVLGISEASLSAMFPKGVLKQSKELSQND